MVNLSYFQSLHQFKDMPNISQKLAEQRFSYVNEKSIHYLLSLFLRDKDSFDGFIQISFILKKKPSDENITLDFEGSPKKLFINTQEYKYDFSKEQGFLKFSSQKLEIGKQIKVGILFECDYHNDGDGAHLYYQNKDSKDPNKPEKPYIYTQFEVNHASKVFPCFDQPDLKAKLTLNTIIHQRLVNIVSNEHPYVSKEKYTCQNFKQKSQNKPLHELLLDEFLNNKEGLMFLFPETLLISTYLYGFIAGDYCQIQCQTPYQTLREKRKIPLKIGCIRSLESHFLKMKDFVFEITLNAFRFYEEYFGIDYVFSKFDQFYCPEFNAGAMENAGIVTYNDQYIWRVDPSEVTESDKVDLANTITHELSHHWFGNLVTMKWWNDLWLNQSFADFISYYCLERIKDNNLKTVKYESAMIDYFYRKEGGYRDDSIQKATHPIRGEVPDTVSADGIFDGITYCKGGSVLKQLQFCINEQNFSLALHDYFNDPKFQFANGTFDDFLDKVRPYFVRENPEVDFDEWKKVWFSQSSFNVVQPQWNPHDFSKQCEMTVVQKYYSKGFKTMRPHKLRVAFVRQDGSYDVKEVLLNTKVDNQETRTVVKYDGSKGYRAILLNEGDKSFLKVGFDKASFDFFKNNYSKIENILARALIEKTLFAKVKDGQIKLQQYLNQFVFKYAIKESQNAILNYIFQMNINNGITNFVPIPLRSELKRKTFYFITFLLATTQQRQIGRIAVLRKNLTKYIDGEDVVQSMLAWRNQSFAPFKNYNMNMDQEWVTVVKAFSLKHLAIQEKWKIFQETAKKDHTKQPQLVKMNLEAFLIQDEKKFLQTYQIFKTDFSDPKDEQKFGRQYSVREKQRIGQGFANTKHVRFFETKQFKDAYFNDLVEFAKKNKSEHFFTFMMVRPIDDNLEDNIERFEKIELEGAKFKKILSRRDKIVDALNKRVKAYELYKA